MGHIHILVFRMVMAIIVKMEHQFKYLQLLLAMLFYHSMQPLLKDLNLKI